MSGYFTASGGFIAAEVAVDANAINGSGRIWTANFSEDGVQISAPKQALETKIYIGKNYWHPGSISYTIPYLHVYTVKAFKKFIRSFPDEDNPNLDVWDEFFPYDKIQKLKNELRT